MKSFTTILLLATVLSHRECRSARAGSRLELVLCDDHVVFATATNISMEMIFRNVGETNLSPVGLLKGLSVVLDGKEFKRDWKRLPSFNILLDFQPHYGWRSRISLSDFLIPPEALASGRAHGQR